MTHATSPLLDLLFDDPRVGRCLVASDGRVVRVNAEWLRSTGVTVEHALGADAAELLPPRMRSLALAIRARRGDLAGPPPCGASAREEELSWEIAPLPADGGTALLVTTRRVREGAGDRERVEGALREGEDRLRLAIHAADIGIWEYDPATDWLEFSAGRNTDFCLSASFSADYATFMSHVHPDDRQRVREKVRLALDPAGDGKYKAEYRWITRRGNERWIAAAARTYFGVVDGRRTPVRMIGTVLDVTPRKRTEEALRASREQLRALAARQELIREQEKTRIARELHDEMGQLLTALRLDVEALEDGLGRWPDDEATRTLLDRAVDASVLVGQTIDALHRVVTALRPAALDRLGLCPALREEGRRFQKRTGVVCRVFVPDEPQGFGPQVDTALFRITQEALTNVARHARASAVTVAVEAADDAVVLSVEDDGKGIDAASIASSASSASSSLGIVGMRERTERLGGELTVSAANRHGTAVRARIPLEAVPRRSSSGAA